MLKSVKTLIAIIGSVYETIDIDNNDELNYVCNIRTLHNNKVEILFYDFRWNEYFITGNAITKGELAKQYRYTNKICPIEVIHALKYFSENYIDIAQYGGGEVPWHKCEMVDTKFSSI